VDFCGYFFAIPILVRCAFSRRSQSVFYL